MSALAEAWRGLPTALVADCLNRFQAMSGALRQLSGGRVCGPALTVRTVAGDSATVHRAVARARAGDVLVVDAGGYPDRAVWGEVLTAAAQRAGIAGVVIDGAVRDLADLRGRGFAAYARGTCPAGPHKGGGGEIGGRIQCAGVPVAAGDVVIGDGDGVVVVPAAEADRARGDARLRQRQEADWVRRIEGGESSLSVLGLEEDRA